MIREKNLKKYFVVEDKNGDDKKFFRVVQLQYELLETGSYDDYQIADKVAHDMSMRKEVTFMDKEEFYRIFLKDL